MTELLTAAQMRAIEQSAIARGEVTGLELMERAGQGVVDAIFAQWPELAPAASDARGPAPAPPRYLEPKDERSRSAVVLCGPGNNGGDGFVVARLLHGLGWHVDVFLYGDAEKLPPDARVNYERWCKLGKTQVYEREALWRATNAAAFPHTDILLIEALFGIGQEHRASSQLIRFVIDIDEAVTYTQDPQAEACNVNFFSVALDTPVNASADDGKADAWLASYDLMVTFHAQKIGHVIGDIFKCIANCRVVDIGLKHQAANTGSKFVNFVSGPGNIKKSVNHHKFSHGHALILSGPMAKGGAARIAARGALRIGAGVVTVGCPPSALLEHATQLTAIMTRKIADAEGMTAALQDNRINALCIGPGLGLDDHAADLVAATLPSADGTRKVVFDADALTLLSRSSEMFAQLNQNCVLTPHAGEFARLFPDIAEKLAAPATKGPAYSKVDATRDAAKRANCVVLYKGPDTVIAHPDGRCSVNAAVYDRAAPWLATAGSGDVLAGFITGLLARGFAPMQAGETAAWLHVECARSFGPGLIAEDLPEELPRVLRTLQT